MVVPDPIVSAWSHIFAPDCSRFTEKMLPDVRVMQISPEINTGGIREEDNRRVQTEEIECDEGKIRSTKEV